MLKLFITSIAAAVCAVVMSAQGVYAEITIDGAQSEAANSVYLPTVNSDSTALCRFGVNGDIYGYKANALRVGWYVNYIASAQGVPSATGAVFMPHIRLTQTGDATYRISLGSDWSINDTNDLKALIAEMPGSEWFIANEPDRPYREVGNQDDISPAVYAIAYHDLYQLIKAEDPTAKVIAGSIVQPTDVRIKYLDLVLQEYKSRYGVQMPVDVWAIHNFILNEARDDWGADIPRGVTDEMIEQEGLKPLRITVYDLARVDLFVEQIVRFRQWLYDNGYRETPVYVSEYGVLFPYPAPDWADWDYPPYVVNDFMNQTFAYMLDKTDDTIGYPLDENRLVQRFSWYSVHDGYYNGDLFTDNRALTEIGVNYASYVSHIVSETDFYPVNLVAAVSGDAIGLSVTVANSGNMELARQATVRFYDGNPSSGGVQIGPDHPVELAGCGDNVEVTYTWNDAGADASDLYVVVTPARSVNEKDYTNNKLGPVSAAAASASAANLVADPPAIP